jgi:A/G-specific adenine glycosylase
MILKFQNTVWKFWKEKKRDLPWRSTRGRRVTPYEILVSEYMLQQTQVDRVIPKYLSFTKHFPDFQTLAKAKEKEVLQLWSGLGYNRRALYLKRAAESIVKIHQGVVPKEKEILRKLPGVGGYMSAVLPVFIYNQREILVETNVRTVFLHHFFPRAKKVSEKEIYALVEKTLPRSPLNSFREWYYALMDYGSYLKKEKNVNNHKHATYKKQKAFKGSLRYVRGAILKMALVKKIKKGEVYTYFLEYTPAQVDTALRALVAEGLLKENTKYFFI